MLRLLRRGRARTSRQLLSLLHSLRLARSQLSLPTQKALFQLAHSRLV
jgi:hypothetical protein